MTGDADAGAGSETGAQSAGPAPGSLWGYCNVDPQSPDPQVLCDDPSHSCWAWTDSWAEPVTHGLCAPTCDSAQITPDHRSFFGIDYALKAECEQQLGGICGNFIAGGQHACYPRTPE